MISPFNPGKNGYRKDDYIVCNVDYPDIVEPLFPCSRFSLTEKCIIREFGMATGILGNGTKLPTEWNGDMFQLFKGGNKYDLFRKMICNFVNLCFGVLVCVSNISE